MVENQTKKTFFAGDTLMKEGEIGHAAYIIESGQVEILVDRGNNKLKIGTRGPGSMVGEMAMIDDQPRTATVRAVEDCEVIEITREDFEGWIENADPVLKMTMHVILTRYRDMLKKSFFSSVKKTGVEETEKQNDLHDVALNAIKMRNELKEAIGSDLVLYYQPIVDIKNRKIAGFEALMRWMHPEKGMISPGAFIPIAEQSGLIVEMSRWALEEACRKVHDFKEVINSDIRSDDPFYISVNFSVRDFATPDFFDHFQETLKKTNTSVDQIHLEITESLFFEQPALASEALTRCHEKGLNISIDDFGTGYSSLSYLHSFPVNTLKIDQSFVRSMLHKENSYTLIRSIIGLAENLNLKVIAEGIEHQEEATALKELNCQKCQGYWFARPMPEADVLTFLKEWAVPDF
jgi:EAL domain-containing protein (putative c-di-GMP-specific phosphodiesterase class I)